MLPKAKRRGGEMALKGLVMGVLLASARGHSSGQSEDDPAHTGSSLFAVDDVHEPAELASDDKKAIEVEPCNHICSYEGKSASCKFRVGWAMQHRFRGDGSACPTALRMVREQCDACARCSLADLGCDAEEGREEAPRQEFDCLEGLFDWQRAWTPAKKDWCCKHKRRGCLVELYNCREIGGGPVSSWDDAKRGWCCQHKQVGCPPGAAPAPAPAPGPAGLRAQAVTAVAPPAAARGTLSPSPGADSGLSVPKTSGEASQRILVGLLTGPIAALAASLIGSFLALAACKNCRGCFDSERQLDGYLPSSHGLASNPSVPGSPSSAPPAFLTNSMPGSPRPEDMQAGPTPRPGPPLVSRAASVPPGSRPGMTPLVSRAASVPPA